MFVSSGTFSSGQGRDAGDALCNADMSGSFALMGVGGESPAQRVRLDNLPFIRPDNVVLFEHGWDLLDAGALLAPIERDLSGQVQVDHAPTGASALNVVGSSADSCDDWTNPAEPTPVWAADLNNTASYWSSMTVGCSSAHHLVCVGP
jgi:hypothetical protein